MKTLNIITLILTIGGGLNWGLIALAHFDLVATLFGPDTAGARIVYGLVGVSALWQIVPMLKAIGTDEIAAEAHSIR